MSTNQILYARTILALGEFGEEAKTATAFVLPFLNDTDETTREDAMTALRRIDPEFLIETGIY